MSRKKWTLEEILADPPTEERVYALRREIAKVLEGRNPAEQGAALALCTAMWVGGHEPKLRETMEELQIRSTREWIEQFAVDPEMFERDH